MTSLVKEQLFGLIGIQDPWILRAHLLRRRILQTDERLREQYLRETAEPRLHIGGGWRLLDGWLNTDLSLVPGVMVMDATKRFPFEGGTIRFVFSEHMIEHVSQEGGASMLRECHRVLSTGGIVRVTTPNLAAILGLYGENLSETQQNYLSWFCETFLPGEQTSKAAYAINAFFRLWGHQHLYDERTLAAALFRAGFHSVKRYRLGESDHPRLRNLEHTERYPDGLLDFESIALEAIK